MNKALARFISRKIGRAILTLLICVTFVFVVLRLSGDPTVMLLPEDTPQEVRDDYRRRWGLDRPLIEQYGLFLRDLGRGDLGVSFAERRRASEVVLERLPNTLLLGGLAITLALFLGIPSGLLAALHHNTPVDRTLMAISVMGFSLPSFFLAILLILLFSLTLRWLPSAGSDSLAHLVMPVLTLSAGLLGKVARFTRTATLEVLGQPYMRTAEAKGLGRAVVLLGHALPNASIPVVTFLGIEIGLILTGAVVVETIFAWPGLGRIIVTAAGQRDLPVVQAAILLIALIMVTSNLAVDILSAIIDPRAHSLGIRSR